MKLAMNGTTRGTAKVLRLTARENLEASILQSCHKDTEGAQVPVDEGRSRVEWTDDG